MLHFESFGDLTQSPPLLSIGGQTYTVNQIKAIVN